MHSYIVLYIFLKLNIPISFLHYKQEIFIERSYVFDSIPENVLMSFAKIEPTDSIPGERTYKDE